MLWPVTAVIFVTVTKSHYRVMTARRELVASVTAWRELVASVSTLTARPDPVQTAAPYHPAPGAKPFTVGAGGQRHTCQHGRELVAWRAVA